MTELFDELYPVAVECGVDPMIFWDMTYDEIMVKVNAYRKAEKEQIQLQALFTYKLGNLIGLAFNDPKSYPSTVKDAFEEMGIFDDVEEKPIKQDWRIMKERMQAYRNLKKKRGGGN